MGASLSRAPPAKKKAAGPSQYKSKVLLREDQVFLDEKLMKSVDHFAKNQTECDAFISFVRSGQWAPKIRVDRVLSLLDEYYNEEDKDASSAGMTKIGYSMPAGCAHMINYYVTSRARACQRQANTSGKEDETLQEEEWTAFEVNSVTTTPEGHRTQPSQGIQRISGALCEATLAILLAQILPLFLVQAGKKEESRDRSESPVDENMLPHSDKGPGLNIFTSRGSKTRVVPVQSASDKSANGHDSAQEKEERIKQLTLFQRLNVTDSEMARLICSARWITEVHRVLDEVSVSVCIASARKELFGFPIVYANYAFTELSGFSTSEIIGKSCRLIQSDHTEPEQIDLIREALRHAKPARVALTNVNRTGDEFINLLALQPVFNARGEYSYVVAVQYDVAKPTRPGATVAGDLKRVEDLVDVLLSIMSM